jgi:hypothetical protein
LESPETTIICIRKPNSISGFPAKFTQEWYLQMFTYLRFSLVLCSNTSNSLNLWPLMTCFIKFIYELHTTFLSQYMFMLQTIHGCVFKTALLQHHPHNCHYKLWLHVSWLGRVNLFLCLIKHQTMETGGITPHILNLGTIWWWAISYTPWLLYCQRKGPLYPLYKKVGRGPTAGLHAVLSIFCSCRESNPDSALWLENIATGYGLDGWGVGVQVLVGARLLSSPCHPDRFWAPSSLLSNGYRGLFPRG